MTEIPKRFKSRDELDMDEELRVVQAERCGDTTPRFETAEYRRYRSDVLREGGLIEEANETETSDPVPLADQTVSEHFDRISGQR